MTKPWDVRWRVEGKHGKRTGQGESFHVVDRTNGTRGFLKTLQRPRHMPARKRFRREATAYETLPGAGLPRLLEHNSDAWLEPAVPLYLVLELIPGGTLGDRIRTLGPCDIVTAAACADRIADIVGQCHAEQVVHRDIKPDNVMLRSDDLRDPVVVNFGLSFNFEPNGPGDVTRIGEEVGNRFLRLPEHARGGRDPVSDVTQAAGLLLYLLTGEEPRVLVDERGLKPHVRPAAAAALAAALDGRRLLRLQSLFDRAFTPSVADRFQSTDEFRAALSGALAPEADDRPGYDALLAHVREITDSPTQAAATRSAARLSALLAVATATVQGVAKQQGLVRTQSGHHVEAWADPPYGGTQLGLSLPGAAPAALVAYCFELRHPDVVAMIDGSEVWRGTDDSDPALADAVRRAAIARFIADNT